MHELGITQNIVEIVGEAAKGRRVTRVTLEIGKLSGVMPDAIAFCFEVVARAPRSKARASKSTRSTGAPLRDLRPEFEAETLFTPCPCGSRRVEAHSRRGTERQVDGKVEAA